MGLFRRIYFAIAALALAVFATQSFDADVIVFCATPAGISAAVGASRAFQHAGHPGTVVILEPSGFIGGMASAGGIGLRDVGIPATVGGIAREWALLNGAAYGNASELIWQPDNFIGDASFRALLTEARVPVVLNASLSGARALREGTSIVSAPVLLNSSISVSVFARVFLDACYEGDLLEAALENESWTFGREPEATYGESIAGVGNTIVDGGQNVGLPAANMSAYDEDGRLWPFVAPYRSVPAPPGTGDALVQAMQYRTCLTLDPSIRVPFSEPVGYNASAWNFLGAWTTQAYTSPPTLGQLVGLGGNYGRRGNKLDPVAQYNTFGLDFVGEAFAADGTPYATSLPGSTARAEIVAAHLSYSQSWFWALATHPLVPAATRADVTRYGLCGDEWVSASPPHWPPQLYVREGRRLIGDRVLTESDIGAGTVSSSSIGIASWFVDSHDIQRFASGPPPHGIVVTEGCMNHRTDGATPARPVCITTGKWWPVPFFAYEIPLATLFPSRSDATNMLVPVCLSASHVAFQTVRLEPTYSILGQAAGVVAATAIVNQGPSIIVQDVDVLAVQQELVQQGAILKVPAA